MAEVLRVIQPISNQKLVRRIETDESRLVLQPFGDPFVQQRTDLERPRFPLLKYSHQTIQRAPGINNIFDQKDVLPFQTRFRIVNQIHLPAGDHPVAITRSHQKVDLKWTSYLPHKIAQKNEASLQQAQHQQVSIRIGSADLSAELRDSCGDGRLIERNSLDGSSGKTRVGFEPHRLDGDA